MKLTKEHLIFYRQNKIKALWGIKEDNINIHTLINLQVNYDPFDIKKKGTKRHNNINLLRLIYKNYKKGYITKTDFLLKLVNNSHLNKYEKRFN